MTRQHNNTTLNKTHSLTFMEVLRVADTDVDGKLSVGEFVKHARRFPQIVKPAHNLQLQLRRRIIGPYFWERRSKALSKRYDLLAAGMFETDWQEAGLGDWWGAYEQKWRHKKLDERDSLDTDFSFGDEKAHAGSSTLFPRVSSSSSSSSSVGSSSFGSGKEKRKGGRSSVSNGARRGSSRVGPSAASTQHGPPQILRTSLLGVQGNDAQQPGATSYAQQQACTFPPASVEAVFNNDAAAAPRIPSGGDSQTSAAATAIVETSLDPYSGSLSRNDDDDLVILTV